MNLCHIYNKTTTSLHIKKILDAFDGSVSYEIDSLVEIGDYNIYVIEPNCVDKILSTQLKHFFDSKMNVLVYFIIPKDYSLMLFQLAFLLEAKSIITPAQDTDKLIVKIKNDFKSYESNSLEHVLGKTLIRTQSLMLFKNSKLIFANKELFEEFGCQNLSLVKEKICTQLDTGQLLQEDGTLLQSIAIDSKEKKTYFVKSMSINNKDEKIISLEPYVEDVSSANGISFIATKIGFIEQLKDSLVEKSISNKSFSIIAIQIENMKKLEIDLSRVEIEELLRDFALHAEVLLDKKLIFAQCKSDLYVALLEDVNDIQNRAEEFHEQISTYINQQRHHPSVGLFVFDIGDASLNDILVILESISKKSLTKELINRNSIEYISSVHEDMNDDEKIELLLENIFINGKGFKLLNMYKGLCINTSSKIIKKTEDTISITFEQIQGIVMRDENETVLQSSSFSKDIRAKIKYIDLQKNIAILEKFEFLNSTANARQYSRVTCLTRTPLLLSYLGGTVNGEIIDISVKSVAIKAKHFKHMNALKSKMVRLAFTLPTTTNEDGFAKLLLDAEVTFAAIISDDYCKIVCDLSEDASNESILMEYVYQRQKEIIVEVKKMVKSI